MVRLPVPRLDVATLNRVMVNAYKVLGFAVLTVLLVGMVSFIGMNAFFFLNESWVAPMVVSPTDDRVLSLSGQLAQVFTTRDKLVSEHAELSARLEAAARAVEAHQAFREEFKHVIASEAASRREELRRLEALRAGFTGAKAKIVRANTAYSDVSRSRLEQLRAARLVDTEEYLGASRQLMQGAQADLALAQTESELENRAIALRRDLRALDAMARAIQEGGADERVGELSYDVFRMKEEFARSGVELAKLRAEHAAIATALQGNEAAMARYDRSLRAIEESPLLHAVDGKVTLAFVPYENADAARKGAPLQACALTVLWCRRVGHIAEVVAGEASGRHPLRNRPERGFLVRVELDDPGSASEPILFAGRAPLLL